MKGRRQIERIVTFVGIAAIGAIIAFMIFLQIQVSESSRYKQGFEQIVIETGTLTSEYQAEEGKWNAKQYDNATMISIVDKFTPKYQELIDRAQTLSPPEKCQAANDNLIKALESEKQSNQHFRDYLATGDSREYEMASKLLTDSLNYSAEADGAIKNC